METLPTFIHIGPGRSASTLVYEALRAHPDICMASIKEICFFDKHYERGESWYAGHFRSCHEAKAIGEVSNSYFFNPEAPSRMKRLLPDVKLLTVLRNPIERMYSMFIYRKFRSRSIPENLDLFHALEYDPALLDRNLYAKYLSIYFHYFPSEQIFVGFYQDLKSDSACFMRQIYRFLDVNEHFVPAILNRKVNPSVRTRRPWLARLAFGTARRLRSRGWYAPLSFFKRSSLFRSLLFTPIEGAAPSMISKEDPMYRRLFSYVEEDVAALEQLVSRSLDEWRP